MNDRLDETIEDSGDPNEPRRENIIPVIEEELVTDTRAVKTGSVRVQKHVETRVREIDLPLLRENVDVKRVPVNRVVDAEPPVRRSGDTVIVPVVEEELIVTKRLVLKEELHIVKHRTMEHKKKRGHVGTRAGRSTKAGCSRPRHRVLPERADAAGKDYAPAEEATRWDGQVNA